MGALTGWGQACEVAAGAGLEASTLFTKLLALPTPTPGIWTSLGTAGGPILLPPLHSLKPGSGLYRGLLLSLLASNRLAPPCPSIQFLGKATTPANENSERARTELYSVCELSDYHAMSP